MPSVHANGVGSIAEIAQIADPGVSRWQPHGEDGGGISRLGPLLSFVPIVAAKHVASTRYMEVVINGPLVKAKDLEGIGSSRWLAASRVTASYSNRSRSP